MPDVGVSGSGRSPRRRNSNLSLKFDLRLELGSAVPDGPVYMAYAGSCVLAAAYPTRAVYAVDNKASMFAEGVPGNVRSWVVSDCEQEFPFPERSFAIADFDAFAMPYPGLLAFLSGAPLALRMALFFTDTALLRVLQHPQFIRFPCGRKVGLVDRVDVCLCGVIMFPDLCCRACNRSCRAIPLSSWPNGDTATRYFGALCFPASLWYDCCWGGVFVFGRRPPRHKENAHDWRSWAALAGKRRFPLSKLDYSRSSRSTKISWTEHTWNPVTGCDQISPAASFAMPSALR